MSVMTVETNSYKSKKRNFFTSLRLFLTTVDIQRPPLFVVNDLVENSHLQQVKLRNLVKIYKPQMCFKITFIC